MKRFLLSCCIFSFATVMSHAAVRGRYVRVEIPADSAILSLAEVEVFSKNVNVARDGEATQSSTANNAVAARAIDGKTSGLWRDGTITHTTEGLPHPIWELDLKKDVSIDKIVLWNRTEIPARLNGALVSVCDSNRNIVWQETRAKASTTSNEFLPAEKKGHAVGTRCPTIQEQLNLLRAAQALKNVNVDALEAAFEAYSKKYPASYPNKGEIKRRLDAFKAAYRDVSSGGAKNTASLAQEFRALQKMVLLQHPAVDFKELIYLKRPVSLPEKQGLFQNYQGNTGWRGNNNRTLQGYQDKLMRGPLCSDTGDSKVLRESKTCMGELCLDFDASRLLMSSGEEGKKNWSLYEINADGTDFRRVINDSNQDSDYYDACYLPDGRIITTATIGFQGVPCVSGGDYVANLFLLDRKAKTMRRLTFDQDINWNPEVYPNGRVVYLRWEYTDSAHYFSRVLMTMNPDGTDQQEFYGSNSYWPNAIFYAQHLPGSSTKFVGIVSGHHGVARKGELVMFDVSKGRIETSGAVHKFPFRGKPIENITKDRLVDHVKPFFLHPRPLNDELILASMADDNRSPFKIVLVDIYDNVLTLHESADSNFYEPIPVKATPRPALQPDRVNLKSKTCRVYMGNVYRGQNTLEGVPFGKVKKLRVFHYEYAPRNSGGHYAIGMEGPWDPRILHGTVDVNADGSCMFEFPANTPLSVQPLDENGNTLQYMRSWLIGMPGETISCIGCHENQSVAPALGAVKASKMKPQKIKPWYGAVRGFAFDREVQPVLDRKCVGCHNDKTQATNAIGQKIPNFSYRTGRDGFSGSYLALHPYVRRNGPEGDYHVLTPLEFHVRTSELYQVLTKGHHGVKLNNEELDRFCTWMELNVPYFGTWTERRADQKMIDQRRSYEKKTTTLTFDPEVVVNPYRPGAIAFEAPQKPTPAPAAPALDNWPRATTPGSEETIDLGGGQTIKLRRIPAGKFVMGSTTDTPVEAPATVQTIAKPFWMGTTEVTLRQMQQFDPKFNNGVYDMHYKDQVKRGYYMGDDPEFPQPGHENFPAIRVSWQQANAFCAWLSKKTGKKVRLPTEKEWEYACRAGTNTPMNYGNFDEVFNTHENLADISIKKLAVNGIDPQPIRNPDSFMDFELKDTRSNDGVLHLAQAGSYSPNGFGLYDMHGNVAEWTASTFKPYPYKPCENTTVDELKTVRGGSWYRRPHRATSAWRWAYPGWQRPFDVGFRVVVED